MNRKPWFDILRALLLLSAVWSSLFCMQATAATAQISNTPVGTRVAANVAPNLMFILDDSGSMASDFLPDNANDAICKSCSAGSCSMTGTACSASNTNAQGLPVATWGEPPFFASQFNTIYYNPNLVYKPGVDYLNATLGNQPPTAARNYPYTTTDTSTRDVVTTYGDVYWCTITNPTAAQLANTTICQRNGVNTGNPFAYSLTSGLPTTTFRNRVTANGSPHYYTVTPNEHCTDETLITCTLSTTPTTIGTVSYGFPAPIRWCRSAAAANSTTAVSGGTPRDCQALIDATYRFPRHGDYVRKDIVPATTTYPRATTRTDCAGAVGPTGCSYAEELQNFANWYSYYRSRILMMKTVPGRVFASIGNDPNAGAIRVGFVTINLNSSAEYLKIDDFKLNTHRQNWFNKLYSIVPGNSTPLREALSRVGRHFAGIQTGINSLMPDDPMIASCQRNYALLTTDGYWNGNAGQTLTGAGIGNQDNVPSASPPIYVDRTSTVTLDSVGTTTATSTPVTTLEQAICTGAGNATFSGPTTTPCGCTGSNKRVMQRTRVATTVVNATDGATTSTTTTNADTYQPAPGPEGICTLPTIITTTTPIADTEQAICTGAANAVFSANGTAATSTPCGCGPGLKRVMQRTISRSSATTTNDGVITAGPTLTTNSTTFAPAPGPEGTCTLPLIVTTITPITDKEHVKCVGSSTATFSDGSTTPCGCSAGQAAIKQRIKDRSLTVITTDGVVTSSTSANSNSFSNFVGCTAQLISQAKTPNTRIEAQVFAVPLNGVNPVSTFAAVNGITAGANAAGACAANQEGIIQRTATWDSTVTTTDGVAGAAVISNTAYAFSTTICRNRVTISTTPVTEIVQLLDAVSPTNFVAAPNGVTPTQGTFTNCAVTVPPRSSRIQRTYSYTRTDTQTGPAAPVASYPPPQPTTASYTIVVNCSTTPGTPAATQVNNGTTTVVSTSALTLVAAATSNSTSPVVVTTSGTNLAVSLTPNPQTATGTATATNNGGTTLAITLSPNPRNGVNGIAVPVSNGGTTLAIALTPNPSVGVVGTSTTTTNNGGVGDTLADVAMYYYKTDLRTTGPLSKDNVPVNGKYIAPHQHMITFTMGLGLDGLMTYRDNYETATSGDFFKIKTGANNCIWTTGTCNWPAPVGDTPTAIDDLWHAAVNGRGKYFSAKAPIAAENGVKETLAAVNIATGAAAAAATSTPNLTTTNNSLYSTTYRTVKWDGEIVARTIDPATAAINPTPIWSAAAQLNDKGLAASDTRTIYTFDGSVPSKLKPFRAATLTASELANFQNQCIAANWSQCSYLITDSTRLAAANNADNLINYLRGQRGNELSVDTSTGYFRAREFLLGDAVSAKPAFMGPPELQYGDPGYSTFAIANANRAKLLFVGANDGMLHALDAATGAEQWAYIPKMLLPNLYRLADASYGSRHSYFVDGSPTLADVFIGGAWKTVLVGGLNSGGRGYYALDVTDPANPKAMWEICSDAALCAISDIDMGLTFGPPVIGKRPSDGKWVALVTSGYNNIGPGNGGGYLYVLDLATGAVLEKVGTTISGTNVGNSGTPNGLAKIAGFVDNFVADNTIKLVYGGDLYGNMWRFDLATSPPTVQRIAQLKDAGGKPQSVTTRPEVTRFDAGFNAIYIGTGRFLGADDVPDPATVSLPFAYQQTIYGFKDTGTDLGSGTLRSGAANLVKQSLIVVDAANRSITNNAVNWATNNGWYVDLNPVCYTTGCSPGGESPGERINLDMQLVRGTLVAVSNEPNADQCTAGGDSILYQFDYSSGSYVPGTPGGIVGTKLGNSLAAGNVLVQPTTGQMTSISTLTSGQQQTTSINTTSSGNLPQRAAWRELIDNRQGVNDQSPP
jgi:type IV pilus assembly protein PilY1